MTKENKDARRELEEILKKYDQDKQELIEIIKLFHDRIIHEVDEPVIGARFIINTSYVDAVLDWHEKKVAEAVAKEKRGLLNEIIDLVSNSTANIDYALAKMDLLYDELKEDTE